jgi:hypothetical protein
MGNATPSRLGQINTSGQTDALFLKVYAGEVMTAFTETNVMMEKHMVRTISSGKSAQFPATWKADAAYHTPGNELTGSQKIKHSERIINIDDLLVSDTFIANIDEAMNHYDVRSIYSSEQGRALARKADKQLLQVGILAARAAATITGGFGGSKLVNANFELDAENLVQGIFAAGQVMDEKDIPQEDRYCFLKPKHYNLLAQYTKLYNKDWGGMGVYAEGKLVKVDNITLVKTNNLPTTNVSADSGTKNTYDGDFTNTVSLIMHRSAIGTVKLLDLAVESEYEIWRQGTLMVAKYAMGHGILRPEAAVELAKA